MLSVVGTRYNIQPFQFGYPTQGRDAYALVPSRNQVYLHDFSAYNASSGLCDIGLAVTNVAWKFYNGAVATSPTNMTTQVQAGAAVNLFDTTAGDGFLIESLKPFGYLQFGVTQAQAGSPAYTYQYWNGAGWQTLTLLQPTVYTATGLTYVVFNPPADWKQGDGGVTANGWYAIRVQASTAGSQTVQATSIRVARWICYRQSVASLGQLQVAFESHPYLLDAGEAVVPFFSTASVKNSIEGSCQQMG